MKKDDINPNKYLKEQLKAVKEPLPEMQETFKEELELLKELCKNKKVLDVGCGTGRPADKLAEFCKELVCIDNDENVLKVARENTPNINNIKILNMNAFKMDFEDNTFDVSYATYNLIGSVDLKKELIKEIRRVTKVDGIIAILTWKRDKPTTEFLKKYYTKIGLKIKEINEDKTVTDKWTFYRVDPIYIKNLFEELNLKEIEIKEVGVWNAIIGKK